MSAVHTMYFPIAMIRTLFVAWHHLSLKNPSHIEWKDQEGSFTQPHASFLGNTCFKMPRFPENTCFKLLTFRTYERNITQVQPHIFQKRMCSNAHHPKPNGLGPLFKKVYHVFQPCCMHDVGAAFIYLLLLDHCNTNSPSLPCGP